MKIMNSLALLFFAAVLNSGVVYCQTTPPHNILGTYKRCPYNCDLIRLNSDFTFDYFSNPGVGDPQKVKGKWDLIDKGKIHLKTFDRPLEVEVVEKAGDGKDKIAVHIIDQNGAVVSDVEITSFSNKQETKIKTNSEGFAEISYSPKIRFFYQNRDYIYQVQKTDTSELIVNLSLYSEPYLDDSFLIKKDKICWVLDNGKTADCHEKVRKSIGEKVFAKNK